MLVAGIIVFAVGVKPRRTTAATRCDAARLALCGGVALYLVGHAAFRLRMVGSVGWEKLVTAAALLLLYVVGAAWPAWTLEAAITILLGAMCAVESAAARREPVTAARADALSSPGA